MPPSRPASPLLAALTPREREILLRDRVQAVIFAYESGIVSTGSQVSSHPTAFRGGGFAD